MPKKAGSKRKATEGAAVGSGSAATADLKKVHGDWVRSTVTERQLVGLRLDRTLPPMLLAKTRAPGNEIVPRPAAGERVCFIDFVNRGFSFPVHDFFRGLMYAYGVQLHDFTPNSILHVACFIVMCECFLGIHPHWGL